PSLASAATRPAVAKAEEAVPTQAGAAAPFVWSLGELKIADAKATFRDDFLTKTNTINAVLQELSVNNLVYDPLKPDATANISVKATIPDLAETLTLAGSATPFSTQRTLELTAAADGIDPVALKPYLDALGLESTLAGASFKSVIRSGIDAHGEGFRGDLQLKETSLTNASGVLFGFPLVSIEGVSHTPADGSTRVNAIRLKGPTLPIRRDADAMLAAFGLRVKGSANEPEKQIIRASDSGPTSQARPPAEFSLPDLTGLPQIAIGEFIWDDINIDFTDVPNDNTHMQVADAVIRAKNLVFGSIQVPATQPATLTAKLSAPGLVGGLAVDGTLVRPDSETYVLNIDAKSADITASQLAPYLAGLGIEPVLKAGSLSAKATGTLQLATDQISAALDASGVSYNDGEATLLAVEGAQLEARLTDNLLSLSRVAIKSPRAIIARDAEGHFIAGGLRIAPAEGAEFQRPFSPMIRLPVPIQLGSLTIDDAEVQWNDERTTAPVSVRATAGITVDNLVVGAKGAPGSVKVSLSADDLVKQLTIAGTLAAEHDRVSAAVRVDGNGLTFDRIAPYLPPGIEPRLKDGTLSLSLEANAGIAAEGGYSADVAVSDLKYNDGASSLARVAQFRASVPRFDPWGGAITIDEVSSAGVEADVTLTRSGTPELLGLAIVPAAANPQEATPLRPTAVATIPSAAAPEQQDLAALVAEARKPLPLLSVDKLDLQLNRLTIHNQLFEDAKDATLSDLRLRNLNRLEWAGENPEARPPTQFEFAAKLSPAVGQVNATATVAPFAAEPSLQLLISASGIRGEALTELAPPLKQFITGERLTEGQFALQLDAQLQPDRRGGGPPDYSRGFGADLAITNTAFRQSPEGQILAGVESIRVEGIRVEPPTGNVTAKSVEIGKPGAY
ncbi:MAG TPA: DUF748 domain-containing protein, partial [Tepidisphaeraceae bacterium]|nr:DUF748 domain-containing protein [Tepidisphaeraceae bacterium]